MDDQSWLMINERLIIEITNWLSLANIITLARRENIDRERYIDYN